MSEPERPLNRLSWRRIADFGGSSVGSLFVVASVVAGGLLRWIWELLVAASLSVACIMLDSHHGVRHCCVFFAASLSIARNR